MITNVCDFKIFQALLKLLFSSAFFFQFVCFFSQNLIIVSSAKLDIFKFIILQRPFCIFVPTQLPPQRKRACVNSNGDRKKNAKKCRCLILRLVDNGDFRVTNLKSFHSGIALTIKAILGNKKCLYYMHLFGGEPVVGHSIYCE